MPTDATVGHPASVALWPIASTSVVAGRTYDGARVSGRIEIGAGKPATAFRNCRIEGTIVTYSPVHITSCVVTGGIYAYDTGGTIADSLIMGGGQAFRPGTSSTANVLVTYTPWTVTDTILRIGAGVPPAHVEASQVLGGVGITFRNVVFDTGGPFNNTQTADLNFWGKDMLCEDCYFVGYGGYAIYSEGPNNVFVRPRFARNYRWGILYPASRQMPTLIDARHLDGSPA